MVAENHAHFCRALLPAKDLVELSGASGIQFSAAIAIENRSQRTAQHTLVGRHPFHSRLMGDCQGFIRHASF